MSDRCTNCDREGCNAIALANAWVNCDCERVSCEHRDAAFPAMDDCEAHRVNWRDQALSWRTVTGFPDAESYRLHAVAQQAEREAIEARMLAAEATLSRLSQLADRWAGRGGYRGVYTKDFRNVLAGTVGGGPKPVVLIPADDWVPLSESLPPLWKPVDLWNGKRLTDCVRVGAEEMWRWNAVKADGTLEFFNGAGGATHWRFTPAPPVVSKTERSEECD